jgi:hypothetical protein
VYVLEKNNGKIELMFLKRKGEILSALNTRVEDVLLLKLLFYQIVYLNLLKLMLLMLLPLLLRMPLLVQGFLMLIYQ